jgi:Phage integrase, N-terminal SAM-like domain
MSEIQRKAKEIIQTSGADTVEHLEKCDAVTHGESFKRRAEVWLEHAQTRSRKPIKPATAAGYNSYITKWLNPYLGDKPLASVDNTAVKELVSTLKEATLSAKTIAEIVGVTKWIVASAIDATGKQKHPREWNHDFMDLPVVDADKQDRPTLDAEEVATCITKATGRYAVL